MKKGKLIKEGKFWKIVSADLKNPMTVPGNFGLTDDMNGKDVSFDTTGGPVKAISYDGKTYTKQQVVIKPEGRQGGRDQNTANNGSTPIGKAHAPYNFVPLNDIVVTISDKEIEKHTGYIDLDFKTITPLFIRGIGSSFFGGDSPVIPGSSIRGMLRSLVEIISYSEMVFTDKDKRFFYRNISDTFYRDKFIHRDNRSSPPLVRTNVKSGWLKKIGREYHLTPSDIDSGGRQYYRINGSFIGSTFQPQGSTIKLPTYSFKKLYIDLSSITRLKRKIGFDLEYNIIGSFSDTSASPKCTHESYLVATGPFARKKHYQWVVNRQSKTLSSINVSSQMELYKMDDNIDENASLLKMLERNSGNPVPCFYLQDSSGAIEAVGHTGIFRLAYLYNVGDFSTQERTSDQIDFSTSIFGNLERQSKIFIEDAVTSNNRGVEIYGQEIYLKILQSPRPTSFQLYIEQPQSENTPKLNLQNWGTNGGRIRGNKLYWHRPTSDDMRIKHSWVFNTNNINDFNKKKNLLTEPVKPVKKDQFFSSRIRFSNLSKEELGVILIALDLPDKCYHKLGMGKPLGLGSIQINPKLTLFTSAKRYKTLSSESEKTWELGVSNSFSMEDCKKAFIDIINNQMNTLYNNSDDFWNSNERMKELKAILLFNHTMSDDEKWLEETCYMSIEKPVLDENDNPIHDDYNRPKSENEYSDRIVLAKPTSFKR